MRSTDPSIYDIEPSEAPDVTILGHAIHATRKDRKCNCGRIIKAGQKYERTTGVEDGKFFSVIMCVAGPTSCYQQPDS